MNANWRKTFDLLIGTAIGILTALKFNWTWLFILVAMYAIIKVLLLIFSAYRMPNEFYASMDKNANGKETPEKFRSAGIQGFKNGYILTFAVSGLFSCILITTIIASLNRLAFSYAVSRPAVLIVLIILNCLLIIGTLRRVW